MSLRGKRIAVLGADQYQEMEVWYPLLRFREDGAETVAVGDESGKTCASKIEARPSVRQTSRGASMRKYAVFSLVLAFALIQAASLGLGQSTAKGKLLYMTLTKGYRHATVDLSKQIVKEIGEKSGVFETTVTDDVAVFTRDNLKNYDVIMFNTTGELPMTDQQKKDFIDFVRNGKGFVGVHSATDTFYMWSEFGELIGGYFNGHPWHEMVTVEVADPSSPIVGFLGKSFQINDEIYQVSDFQAKDCHVLLRLDPVSVDLKKQGVQHRYYGWPIAWTRSFGKGKVYYNGLGHDDWVWKDPRFQDMLLHGIKWTLGRTK